MLIIASILGILVIASFTFIDFKTNKNLLSPLFLFGLFSLVDIYFPLLLWEIFNINPTLEGISIQRPDLFASSVLYIIYFLCFTFSYVVFSKKMNNRVTDKGYNTQIFNFFLVSSISIYCYFLFLEISFHGGILDWFVHKSIKRWDGALSEFSVKYSLIIKLKTAALLIIQYCFISYAVKNINQNLGRVFLFFVIFVILGLTQFFRGSTLSAMYALVGAFQIVKHNQGMLKFNQFLNRSFFYGFIFILFFLCVGTIRKYYQLSNLDRRVEFEEVAKESLSPLYQGSGILGLAHIYSKISSQNYFWGKTYVDMLLLPVPRAIWTSKPEWYGIDDINRSIGLSDTTQNATTIPGEGYANFGMIGILLSGILFGIIFGRLNYLYSNQNAVLFILFVPSLIHVCQWMAFTGLVNFLVRLPVLLLVHILIQQRIQLKNGNS